MRATLLQTGTLLGRGIFSICGAIVAFMQPTLPFILICTMAVLVDMYTAWSLSRRVMKRHPGANDGKFKSCYAGKVFETLIKIYLLIVLSFLIETYIFEGLPIRLANIAAGAVCFWQVWSMLENESSCNNARWAKVVQHVMVDKAERHFDIDLSELKKLSREKDETNQQKDITTLLSVNMFDARKLENLIDNNEYLQRVLEFNNGRWYINTDEFSEIERLLNKNRIRYKIKQI